MMKNMKQSKISISPAQRAGTIINYFVLTLLAILCLYPVWYVAVASFSDSNLLMQHNGLMLFPKGFSLSAYERVFSNPMILRGYGNTLFVLFFGLALSMLLTCLGAYFLSRKNVMFRKPIMILIVITMFFQGGMIPTYLNMRDFHLTGTLWGLIIPFAINTQNLIIMTTSFSSIPDSLVEAARIDGAGHFTVLFRVVLPLSKAILAVIVLYYGVQIWNSWFWASAILREREMYPLQVVLREILLQNSLGGMSTGVGVSETESVAMSIKYATIMVATVPILCVYPFLQKYFAKGVMVGAVKG